MDSNKKFSEAINKFIRPSSFPVAIRNARDGEEPLFKKKYPKKDIGGCLALCQGISLARKFNWTIVFREDDHACPISLCFLGHRSPEKMMEGIAAYPFYVESLEIGKAMEKSLFFMPQGIVRELWISPLEKCEFEPDVVLIYGNPAQMARLVQAANYWKGTGIECRGFGRGACSSSVIKPMLTNECCFTIPGGGERVFAATNDDEMVFSVPRSEMKKIGEGLEITHKMGMARMPTPFHGVRVTPAFPDKYYEIFPDKD